jgi:hypothetical protein
VAFGSRMKRDQLIRMRESAMSTQSMDLEQDRPLRRRPSNHRLPRAILGESERRGLRALAGYAVAGFAVIVLVCCMMFVD